MTIKSQTPRVLERPTGDLHRLLTEEEAALFAAVDRKTIRRLIEAGRLPAADYGTGKKRLYRINPEDLMSVKRIDPAPAPLKPYRHTSLAAKASLPATAYLPWNKVKNASNQKRK